MSSTNAGVPVWRKSTRSQDLSQGMCVEVAAPSGALRGIRDSKNSGGPYLMVPVPALSALITLIKAGEHAL